jgi:hypothetical protein
VSSLSLAGKELAGKEAPQALSITRTVAVKKRRAVVNLLIIVCWYRVKTRLKIQKSVKEILSPRNFF